MHKVSQSLTFRGRGVQMCVSVYTFICVPSILSIIEAKHRSASLSQNDAAFSAIAAVARIRNFVFFSFSLFKRRVTRDPTIKVLKLRYYKLQSKLIPRCFLVTTSLNFFCNSVRESLPCQGERSFMEIFDEDLPPKILHRIPGPGFSSRFSPRASPCPSDRWSNQQFFYKGTRATSRVSIPGGRTRSRIIFSNDIHGTRCS